MSAIGIGWTSKAGRRPDNQDVAFDRLMHEGLFVAGVADGAGGHAGGARAAHAASSGFVAGVMRACADGVTNLETLACHGFDAAEIEVQKAAQAIDNTTMATTLTAVVGLGPELAIVHLGDSRLAHVRSHGASAVTPAHTLEAEAPPGTVPPNRRHVLTGALTAEGATREPWLGRVQLAVGESAVLTTDGAWSTIPDAELPRLMNRGRASAMARRIVELALRRGSGDNATSLVVHHCERRRVWVGPTLAALVGAAGAWLALPPRVEPVMVPLVLIAPVPITVAAPVESTPWVPAVPALEAPGAVPVNPPDMERPPAPPRSRSESTNPEPKSGLQGRVDDTPPRGGLITKGGVDSMSTGTRKVEVPAEAAPEKKSTHKNGGARR